MLALQGITIADPNLPDCPLMYVNEAFCRMTGYDQDEILGRNCRFLQGPETDRASLARIRVAMQQVTSHLPCHLSQDETQIHAEACWLSVLCTCWQSAWLLFTLRPDRRSFRC